MYDFDIEVEWTGIQLSLILADSDTDEAKGTYKLKDVNSIDPDIELIGL